MVPEGKVTRPSLGRLCSFRHERWSRGQFGSASIWSAYLSEFYGTCSLSSICSVRSGNGVLQFVRQSVGTGSATRVIGAVDGDAVLGAMALDIQHTLATSYESRLLNSCPSHESHQATRCRSWCLHSARKRCARGAPQPVSMPKSLLPILSIYFTSSTTEQDLRRYSI